jgi:hypothetical protein
LPRIATAIWPCPITMKPRRRAWGSGDHKGLGSRVAKGKGG